MACLLCVQILICVLPVWYQTIDYSGISEVSNIPQTLKRCASSLQHDLDEAASVWNSHKIRPSRNDTIPCSRPDLMYNLPENFTATDYLCEVSDTDVEACAVACRFTNNESRAIDRDVGELVSILMIVHNWMPPVTHRDAVELYLNLRRLISTGIATRA